MEAVKNPALALRVAARTALIGAGGRGFVRFLPADEALLVTDAPRRCADEAALTRLISAMEAEGFACGVRDGLMTLTPGDALLDALAGAGAPVPVDWDDPLHSAQELAARWLRAARGRLTPAGRRLIMETLRLIWQPRARVLDGLEDLRAQAAEMLRNRDRSGMAQAGALLADWCRTEGGQTR